MRRKYKWDVGVVTQNWGVFWALFWEFLTRKTAGGHRAEANSEQQQQMSQALAGQVETAKKHLGT